MRERMNPSPGASPYLRFLRPNLPQVVAAILILLYVITFGTLSVLRHETFDTSVFDLGNADQAVWNTTQGRILHFTTQPRVGESRLGMHVEPILILVALLYFVYPSPKTLLILQTLAIGLSAWPVFLLARRRLGSPWAGVAFVAAYLLWPGLESANLFEFHAVALAPFFLLWAFYFLELAIHERHEIGEGQERRHWALFAFFLLLALSTKEDISLLTVMLGLYVALVRRRVRAGAIIAAVGLAWFIGAVEVVIPYFRRGRESPFLFFYQEWGRTPLEIAWTVISRPGLVFSAVWTLENWHFLRGLLLPFAFLPLLEPAIFTLTAPSLAISLLSANPLIHRIEGYHYAAPFAPFVVIAAVYGAGRLVHWLQFAAVRLSPIAYHLHPSPGSLVSLVSCIVLLTSLYYHYYRGFSPLALPYQPVVVTEHDRLGARLAASIPPDAAVSAQAELIPHLSQRKRIEVWPNHDEAQYIFLDVSHPRFDNRDRAQEHLYTWLNLDYSFGLIAGEDGYLLMQRDESRHPFRPPFFTFADAPNPSPQYPLVADFGDGLRFLGFDVHLYREEEPTFTLYWLVQKPLDQDYFIALYLLDEQNTVVGATIWKQPTLIWYPTSSWQVGRSYRVLANTFPWWTADRNRFGIALGVVEGDDPWRMEKRLRPRLIEAPGEDLLLSGGTLLRLIGFRRIWQIPYPVQGER
jgi:uncharacterized membrane protein